jgi:S-ribosylhomocysteine lyase LuxS involved in autoinducer biosynthesis
MRMEGFRPVSNLKDIIYIRWSRCIKMESESNIPRKDNYSCTNHHNHGLNPTKKIYLIYTLH